MAWPPAAIAADKTNATVMEDDHAPHHNTVATAINDLVTADPVVAADIGVAVQAYDAELAAIAGLTSAADALPYFTGSGTAAVTTFTAAGRALIGDADAAAQRTTLGLVIGTDVAAPSATWTWRSVDSKSGAAYDVVADDVGRLIRMTTAHDVNIPNTLGMATGSQFGILLTGASGNVTDGSSVVLNGAAAGAGSFAMTAHQIIVCTVLATDTYNVSGV